MWLPGDGRSGHSPQFVPGARARTGGGGGEGAYAS